MSKSERIRGRDLVRIYRLIGECRDLGADAPTWKRHMFAELAKLVGAQVGIGGEVYAFWDGFWQERTKVLDAVDVGWTAPKERQVWMDYLAQGGPRVDFLFQEIARLPKSRLLTVTRRDLIGDKEWYKSHHFNAYRRQSNVDFCVNSLCTLPADPTVTNIITVLRTVGDRPFTRRECRIVHFFHHELAPLIGRQLSSGAEPSVSSLAPRVRQTLGYLLAGDGEKQIAYRVGLSRETVHQYVKVLYRHFGVNSRGELMAYWIQSGRRPLPSSTGC